jgi:hypothetical protein
MKLGALTGDSHDPMNTVSHAKKRTVSEKFLYRASQYERGFSTIEILIAFGIGIMFLSASLMIAYSDPHMAKQYVLNDGHSITLDAILDSTALATSSNMLGAIVATLREKWNSDIENTDDGLYTNTPIITDISPCTKSISNTTTWNAQHARSRNTHLESTVGSVSIARALGQGVCDPIPPSTWSSPENPHWETSPGDITGTPTGMSYAVIQGVPYIFMTTTNTVQSDDLWIIDVSDIENLGIVASLETGDDTHTKGLLDGVVVTHSDTAYAYLLQNSSTSQLVTVDVRNPLLIGSPVDVISFAPYGVNPNGSNPEGRVITYYDGRLYIGLRTTIGPEFLIFDITSNPAQPTFIGSSANSFDHSIYDITVRDDYAYLAIKPGSPPSGNNTRELMVMDIRSTIPRDTGGGYNATSTTNDTEGAMSLYLIGDTLYMGRERVSNVAEKDFYAFDISSSTHPVVSKSSRLGISTGGGLGVPRVTDLVVQNISYIRCTT